MRTRSVGALFGAAMLSLGLAACGGDDDSGGAAADASKEPLVIAVFPPSAGPLAKFGSGAVNGWKLAADEVNAKGGVDGHQVKIVTLQTDGTPATVTRLIRRAVTQEKAKFLSGIITSGENAAIAPQLAGLGVVNLVSTAKDDSLTGEACSPNMYRTTISSAMDVHATTSVTDQLPAKKWALHAADILVGHSALDGFEAVAKEHGKPVELKQFAPLGTTEFGSQISKIEKTGADGLYIFASGADGVAFVNQAKQFKLFDKVKTVVGFSTFSDETFEAMGDEIEGFYNNLTYASDFDNPHNKAFVAAYEKAYGEKPFFIPAENYLTAQFLFEAVKKAGSVDVAKVKAAMDGLTVDTINGKLTMRPEDHQALRDTYVGKIVKKEDGKLGWEVVSTVPPDQSTPKPSADCKL